MIETGFVEARFIYEFFTVYQVRRTVAIICRRATTVRGSFYLVQGFLVRYYSPSTSIRIASISRLLGFCKWGNSL